MKTKTLALSILLLGPVALAGESESKGGKSKVDGGTHAADNTAVNQRDNQPTELTADQQKNNRTDLDLTANIRRSIMSDKTLSTNAHNVKIIAQNGVVTLKGPVESESEKQTLQQKASSIAGQSNVKNEIDVKP